MKISIVRYPGTEGRGRRVVPLLPVFPLFSRYAEQEFRRGRTNDYYGHSAEKKDDSTKKRERAKGREGKGKLSS